METMTSQLYEMKRIPTLHARGSRSIGHPPRRQAMPGTKTALQGYTTNIQPTYFRKVDLKDYVSDETSFLSAFRLNCWLTTDQNELKWAIVEKIQKLQYTPENFLESKDETGRRSR